MRWLNNDSLFWKFEQKDENRNIFTFGDEHKELEGYFIKIIM